MNDSQKGWAAIGMAARSVALNGAPLRSVAHTHFESDKTKPTPRAGVTPPSDLSILEEMMACGTEDSPKPQRRSAALPGASQRSAAHRSTSVDKSNPTPSGVRPLTSRQLAAARLVAQGMRSAEVAGRLKTIPQTINRWKKLPAFDAELQRLHERLVLHGKS